VHYDPQLVQVVVIVTVLAPLALCYDWLASRMQASHICTLVFLGR
jgi:hypothetical protein